MIWFPGDDDDVEGDKGYGGRACVTKGDGACVNKGHGEFQFAVTILVIPTFKLLYENYNCIGDASGSRVQGNSGVRIGKPISIRPRSTRKKKPTLKSVKNL